MSLDEEGQHIVCDGTRCQATLRLYDALCPVSDTSRVAEGWLFVATQKAMRHFCPRCAHRYLATLDPGPIVDPGPEVT